MERHVYDEMIRQDTDSWYYRGKRAALRSMLQKFTPKFRTVVDFGCGTGANAEILPPFLAEGGEYVGVEPYELPSHVPERMVSRIIRKRLEDVTAEDIAAPADLLMMVDVLEHVEEGSALAAARRLLHPEGLLLVTVPAYKFLWSRSDDENHHLRRYTPHGLRTVLAHHGFELLRMNHYFFFAFLPLAVFSRLHLPRRHFGPSALGWILAPLAACEGWLGQWIRWPFGTGLIVLAKRKKAL